MRAHLPKPKATSAPAVGSTTWWSGFWNTNPAGSAVRTKPSSGGSSPPAHRSSVLLPHLHSASENAVALQELAPND